MEKCTKNCLKLNKNLLLPVKNLTIPFYPVINKNRTKNLTWLFISINRTEIIYLTSVIKPVLTSWLAHLIR
jgi:hypothetical protein